jgi:adenine-specific DNA methylase
MNFLWESWLGIKTCTRDEAIVNKYQNKDYGDYQRILCRAFSEMRRVLKDGSWLTVVFHNSSDMAWKAIQTSLHDAGFSIEGTQTFDKKHGTFKMFVSDNAVGYDLVLHCRKANKNLAGVERTTTAQGQTNAREYVLRSLRERTTSYNVHFLHVARRDEFDYRRLYADWLSDTIRKREVTVSFEEFRSIVDDCGASL